MLPPEYKFDICTRYLSRKSVSFRNIKTPVNVDALVYFHVRFITAECMTIMG
jgi:hypothetical protein